jgi:hypothetical protein
MDCRQGAEVEFIRPSHLTLFDAILMDSLYVYMINKFGSVRYRAGTPIAGMPE